MKTVSIIVPFYNESLTIDLFCKELFSVIKKIKNIKLKLIFVNDGSSDDTLSILKKQLKLFSDYKIISFTRNFGHEASIKAGIDNCNSDAAIIMDGDLQDSPNCIPEMIDKWLDGFDVVNVKRSNRKKDSIFKRLTAKFFYKFIKSSAKNINIIDNVNNFRLISYRIITFLKNNNDKNGVFRFEVPYTGFKACSILSPRLSRVAGKTHYHLSNMFSLAIDSVVSISTKPLNFISKIFLFLLAIFICSSITELILYILFLLKIFINISTTGYIIWLISNCFLFINLILLLSIAIVAQYIARMHTQLQTKPLYIIDKIYDKDSSECG